MLVQLVGILVGKIQPIWWGVGVVGGGMVVVVVVV
jgi:hypothetical protein